METALKEKVSPEKVREMVARGCTFQELKDTFHEPREYREIICYSKKYVVFGYNYSGYSWDRSRPRYFQVPLLKLAHHDIEINNSLYGRRSLFFYDTKEEAVVSLAYKHKTNVPVNEKEENAFAVNILKDGDIYKYSIEPYSSSKVKPDIANDRYYNETPSLNIISSIPDEFLSSSSNIENKVVCVGRCVLCKELSKRVYDDDKPFLPNYYADQKVYREEKWELPHKVCLDSYVEKINGIKETALDTKDNNLLSIVEADILTLKNGPEIFEKGRSFNIGYDFEKYVYQVGQLTKEADESGVFPGKAFVVTAFDPKKKEFEQVYRLNVNCENEKVFTETAKFVSRNTDMRQPLGETMTDEFIEKIEKFAKKQEKAVGKKQPAKTL